MTTFGDTNWREMKINKPTLVVDIKRVTANVERMRLKLEQSKVIFRPHFKTHQSLAIANLFRERGIDKCAVSSVGMAQYFADDGWNDIIIAFPANVLEAEEMDLLAQKIRLQIIVDSVEKVNVLSKTIKADINLAIEIDTGYKRSGISDREIGKIEQIIDAIDAVTNFNFVGFLSHTGNTYTQRTPEEIVSTFENARESLVSLKSKFIQKHSKIVLSMGDTPAASLAENLEGIDEMRPGNFVFYDVMQFGLKSCEFEDIATAVYCPIVAIYPEKNQVIVYGGGVHLSKESAAWNGRLIYGLVSKPNKTDFGNAISDAFVESLSQEHGTVSMPAVEISKLKLGDILAIYPIHSCMTVDLNSVLLDLDGNLIPKYRTY